MVFWELMECRVPWAGGGDISKQEVIDSVVRRGERLPIPSGCNRWGPKFRIPKFAGLIGVMQWLYRLPLCFDILACIELPMRTALIVAVSLTFSHLCGLQAQLSGPVHVLW